jgi:hypothetical protein
VVREARRNGELHRPPTLICSAERSFGCVIL